MPGDQVPPVVQAGVLKNAIHGFHFPIPKGWSLTNDSTSNEMMFTTLSCDECFLRILVTSTPVPDKEEESDSLQQAVKAIKEHIASEPGSRVLGEEAIKVARKDAYTVLKEESAPPGPAKEPASAKGGSAEAKAFEGKIVKTRFVTFQNGGERYYLLLKAPESRFPSDDAAFETLLAKFRFDS